MRRRGSARGAGGAFDADRAPLRLATDAQELAAGRMVEETSAAALVPTLSGARVSTSLP